MNTTVIAYDMMRHRTKEKFMVFSLENRFSLTERTDPFSASARHTIILDHLFCLNTSSFLPFVFIIQCQIYAHFQRSRIVRKLRPSLISLFSCEKQKSLSFYIPYSDYKVTRLCMSILTLRHFTKVMMFLVLCTDKLSFWSILFLFACDRILFLSSRSFCS